MLDDNKGELLTTLRGDSWWAETDNPGGIPLFASFSSLPLPLSFCLSPQCLPLPFFSPKKDAAWISSHCHGNQDLEDVHVIKSPDHRLARSHKVRREGWNSMVMSHSQQFTDGRVPLSGRPVTTHTDTMGVFSRWGWAEVDSNKLTNWHADYPMGIWFAILTHSWTINSQEQDLQSIKNIQEQPNVSAGPAAWPTEFHNFLLQWAINSTTNSSLSTLLLFTNIHTLLFKVNKCFFI